MLTEIPSAALGLLYLVVFGVGSIGGMLLMSGLYLVLGAVLIGVFLKRMQALSSAAPKARHEAKQTVKAVEHEVSRG